MQVSESFLFECGHRTDVGCRRQINEDSYLSRPDFGLWVVADGMGGHEAGDFASQTIVEELQSVGVPATLQDLEARFLDRLTRANRAVREHAAQIGHGTVGATIVALLIHGDDYACLWSGDSRIYRLRDDAFMQCTRDHTELQSLLDANAISQEEAKTWPRRNVITRAIGVTEALECDRVEGKLRDGDRFVLCSDGLTEHLEDEEIAQYTSRLSPKEACDAMIAETLERGAKDNVTVITVAAHPAPPEPDEEDEMISVSAIEAESEDDTRAGSSQEGSE